MNSNRRFPPPWTVEELDACFVMRDRNGQQLDGKAAASNAN
jgi:hypothetical protein